jgi:hypothetical protein
MSFENKYLKYKQKYLNLKNIIAQKGGSENSGGGENSEKFRIGEFVKLRDGSIGKVVRITKKFYTDPDPPGGQVLHHSDINGVLDKYYLPVKRDLTDFKDIKKNDILTSNRTIDYNINKHIVKLIANMYVVSGNTYEEFKLEKIDDVIESHILQFKDKRVKESDSQMTGVIIGFHLKYTPHFHMIMRGDDGKIYDKHRSHFTLL